jgi:Zn-ribbon RNA-binding protein
MGSLKDWNEALVAHFLRRPAKNILFNVTQDVISSIHESGGFQKSRNDPIEDFLMSLCNGETGYGKKIDDKFACKTTEKRKNGWPVNPEYVFWNAYELRSMFQYGNRESVVPEKQYFKFPDFVPPWTSHLALTILAVSMNVGDQPGVARYQTIADLFTQKMNLSKDSIAKIELKENIQHEYTKKFFGSLIAYRSYRSFPRPPRIVVYYYNNNKTVNSPWGVLYKWAKEQSKFPGSFYGIGGTIRDPVTVHSRFRIEDRNTMLGALNSLSPGVLPSNSVLDQVIRDNKYQFRQTNTSSISKGALVALREYALGLWQNNQSEIRSYSPNNGSNPSTVSGSNLPNTSEFQVMPYLFIDIDRTRTKRVQAFFPSLHHISGPIPEEGQVITIGVHNFQFNGTKRAISSIPINSNSNLKLIRSEEVIEYSENGKIFKIYSFNASIDIYTITRSHIVLTQDLNGMYEWSPEDEVSKGYRIIKGMGYGYNDELLSKICGFDIGLKYDYDRPKKTMVREIGRTKIKLAGGSKISGGTDRRYHFEGPPHFVLTRGFSTDVEFKKINPKDGEEGNRFLKDKPGPIQEKGKTIWKLSLKDDIFTEDSDSAIVKVLYKLKTEEALTEVSFTVVRGVDHWQLHPIAVFEEQKGIKFSEFDSSVFTSKDSCEPMTEEQKIAKDKAKEAEEAEAKLKAEKEAEKKADERKIARRKIVEEINSRRRMGDAKYENLIASRKIVEEINSSRRDAKSRPSIANANDTNPESEINPESKPKPEPVPETEPEVKPRQYAKPIAVKPQSKSSEIYVNPRPGSGATKCISCGVPLVDRGSTCFPCPNCYSSIGRCPRCRSNGVNYHCLGCDFVGP